MTVAEIATALGMEQAIAELGSAEVTGGYSSDLLSDVMAHAAAGSALITIQAHKNTVAVAVLLNLPVIILCNGRTPPDDMVEAARIESIALLSTGMSQFEVSGKLFALLAEKKEGRP